MTNSDKIQYLSSQESRHLLAKLSEEICETGFTTNRISCLKSLSPQCRIAILEQLELRQKALAKFSYASQLLFTRLSLQQTTREPVSRYKAQKIGTGFTCAADLCCGLGGESFHLKCPVIGVDKDAAAIRQYHFNMDALKRPHLAVRADVNHFLPGAEFALLDPARRQRVEQGHWDQSQMSPAISTIQSFMKTYRAMCIKLPPGIKLQEPFTSGEMEYIGFKDECVELCVWCGEFAPKPGTVRATELPGGETTALNLYDIPETFDSIDKPGDYLYEPVKALVRSHLFAYVGQQKGLWQIDPRIAYLSGNHLIRNHFFKAYKIIDIFPFNLKIIQKKLRAENVGYVTIKKRGVREQPGFFQKNLKLKGTQGALLVVTRVKGKKTVLWVEPV